MELITNKTKEKTVKEIVNKVKPACDELYIEVGYIYYSGFDQIYKQLENKRLISWLVLITTERFLL